MAMDRTIVNARITSTMLGFEDHGLPTCFLHLDYGNAGQAFGGYHLGKFGFEFVQALLKTLEIEQWEKLPGTFVRADQDHGNVYRLGHLLKDRWFDPKEFFKEYLGEKEKGNANG